MPMVAICINIVATIVLCAFLADALAMGSYGRREVLQQGSAALAVAVADPGRVSAALPEEEKNDDDELRQVFQSLYPTKQKGKAPQRTIEWSPTSRDFSQLRYSTSSLSTKETVVPESTCKTLPQLPIWMKGHWLATYKFDGVSFPNGRDQLSLTLPGAGLGTCAAIPNVGFNPAPFVQRFGSGFIESRGNSDPSFRGSTEPVVVEDMAYNLPRKFEGFWPAAKVSSVRVSTSDRSGDLGPACLVTGEGCSMKENLDLHGRHATRCQMEFQGPTRRGGLRTQHLDMSMVDASTSFVSSADDSNNEFLMARSFVQYNQEQELTGYYREFVSYDRQQSSNEKLQGRTCVAAFLPSSPQAVALYRYKIQMHSITEEEAMTY